MRQFLTYSFLLITSFHPLFGQLSNIVWLHHMNTPDNLEFCDIYPLGMTVDKQGNSTYLASFFSSVSLDNGQQITHTNPGLDDRIMLVRYDKDGNVQWTNFITGSIGDQDLVFNFNARLGIDTLGNTYVAGNMSSGALSFGNGVILTKSCGNNCTELFLAKYNAAGVAQWAKAVQAAPGKHHQIAGVGCDDKGRIYIAGTNGGSSLTFEGGNTFSNLVANQQFVARLSNTGMLDWFQSLESNSGEAICSMMRVAPDGSVYTAGNYLDFPLNFGNDLILGAVEAFNGYVVKYNAEGLPVWAHSLSAPEVDLLDMAIDAQGSAYIVCDFESTLLNDGNVLTASGNAFTGSLLKIDSLNTNVLFQIDYSEELIFPLFTTAVTPSGRYYTGGLYAGEIIVGSLPLVDKGLSDILLTTGTPGAAPVSASIGGEGGEAIENFHYGSTIGLDKNGYLYISGYYYEDGELGNYALGNSGIFIAKLNTGTVGTDQAGIQKMAAQISPNPGNGLFNIQTGYEMEQGRLTITDMQGKIMIEQPANGTSFTVNMQQPGCYALTVQDQHRVVHGKLVVTE